MKKIKLIFSIALTLLALPGAFGQSPLSWNNYGTSNVPNSNDVVKTDPDGWTTGGASSQQKLAASCNGYFEFTIPEWDAFYVGVSNISSGGNPTDIDRGLFHNPGGFSSSDNGVLTFLTNFIVLPGDKIRIEKDGNTITFWHINSFPFFTQIHQTTLNGDILAEVQLYFQNDSILNGVVLENCCSEDADWFVENTTDAPNSINDNIYTMGDVGIGLDSPSTDLDVNGEVKIRLLDPEPLPKKILIADNTGMVKYASVEDVAVSDEDWLKPTNDQSDNINDDIYTNGNVGINVTNPQAHLDMRAFCNNQPTFRIHRDPLMCDLGGSYGNLIQVEAEDGYPTPVTKPYLVMDEAGRTGIGTDPGADSRVKICNNLANSALTVRKSPGTIGNITSEIRVGGHSGNHIALSINDGDCNGSGMGIVEIMKDGSIVSNGMMMISDQRFKHDIQRIEHPMEKLRQLRGVTYTFDQETEVWKLPTGTQTGVIAQEVEKVIPDAVYNHSSGFKTVNYDKLIPLLIEAVKFQDNAMNTYDDQIVELQAEIDEIRSMINLVCEDKCEQLKPEGNGTGSDEPAMETGGIELYQNQPNPFNNSTVIPYYIPEHTELHQAMLVITNITGKIIREYPITQTGHQEVSFDRNELSGGYYTYSLVINGEKIKTLKAIIK